MIVVAGRAGSVDGLRLIRLVVEEVEVGSLLVQRSVGNDNTNHRASEFAKLAVFVREGGGVEIRTDLGPALAIVTPFEPGATTFDAQTEIDRLVFHSNTGVKHFRLVAILKTHDRNRAAAKRLRIILAQENIIHVVVVDGQASAVLVDFRLELHLGGHRGIHARQLASKQARTIQRGKRFLTTNT